MPIVECRMWNGNTVGHLRVTRFAGRSVPVSRLGFTRPPHRPVSQGLAEPKPPAPYEGVRVRPQGFHPPRWLGPHPNPHGAKQPKAHSFCRPPGIALVQQDHPCPHLVGKDDGLRLPCIQLGSEHADPRGIRHWSPMVRVPVRLMAKVSAGACQDVGTKLWAARWKYGLA